MTGGSALLVVLLQSGAATAEPTPAPTAVRGADLQLLEDVRRIADRVSEMRGQRFDRPPVAVRTADDLRETAAEIRALNVLDRERLAARGRAWADLGLGGPDTPERLLRVLAADVEGVGFDPQENRLLVAPNRLTGADFEPKGTLDERASVLMSTGVRPDEPLVSHVLMHVRQRERAGRDWLDATTDVALARAAWAEGEANLLALRYLFAGMGLADTVVEQSLDPATVLDGGLVSRALGSLDGVEQALVRFVYEEGYVAAGTIYRRGGWAALDEAMKRRGTCRDVLHPLAAATPARHPAAPEAGEHPGLTRVDEDSLGQQVVVALVSALTGKDSLALQAADGWVGDRLWRFEPPGGTDPGRGRTLWVTLLRDEQAAQDFDYALGRAVGARFPASTLTSVAEAERVLDSAERRFRLQRRGTEVRLTIEPRPARSD